MYIDQISRFRALLVVGISMFQACADASGMDDRSQDVRVEANEAQAFEAALWSDGLPAKISALTWNIRGGVEENVTATPERKIAELVQRVKDDDSLAVLMIQETCESAHSRPLELALNSQTRGTWIVHHRTARKIGLDLAVRCPLTGKFDAGVAIAMRILPGSDLVRHHITFTSTVEPQGTHTQGAACVEDRRNRLFACSAHFAFAGADAEASRTVCGEKPGPAPAADARCADAPVTALRAASARDLHQLSTKWQAAGYRTIFGGDFNLGVDAPELRVLYDGNFEGDPAPKCGTFGGPPLNLSQCIRPEAKIDYLFFGDSGWDLEDGRVLYEGHSTKPGTPAYDMGILSDHWMLKASVTPVSF